ncbi:hypothetical protein ACSDR0_11630 [Streptosporangium sp. G11]|uniref:hypothetical protein n=1 Tax=Streptosporangium sp. G11 TaxID=3436926 RepID=UPI003EBF0D24
MTAVQDGLFTEHDITPAQATFAPYLGADPERASAALADDAYGWLAAFLPAPRALICSRCGRPMALAAVPLLWECRPCDTPDTAAAEEGGTP